MLKPNDNSPTILIPVSCDNPDFGNDCNYAVIFFTMESIKYLLEKKKIVKEMFKEDKTFVSIKYYNPVGVYFINPDQEHDIGITDDIYDDLDDKQTHITEEMFKELEEGKQVHIEVDKDLVVKCEVRTDGEYIIVTDDHIQFYFRPKHGSQDYFASLLYWEDIDKIHHMLKPNSVKFIEEDK